IQPVLGVLSDVFSKTRLLILCLGVAVVSGIVCAFASSFEFLVVGRVMTGIAVGGIYPTTLAMTGSLVPVAQRQGVVGRLIGVSPAANRLGASVAGIIGDLFGWRFVFVVPTLVAAATMIASIVAFRRYPFDKEVASFDARTIRSDYAAIVRNPLTKYCFVSVF